MSHQLDLFEDTAQQKLEFAFKAGLARNLNRLTYYKRAAQDPHKAVQDPLLRPFVAELLTTLLTIMLTDSMIWNRVKSLLLKRQQPGRLKEDVVLNEADLLGKVKKVLREKHG